MRPPVLHQPGGQERRALLAPQWIPRAKAQLVKIVFLLLLPLVFGWWLQMPSPPVSHASHGRNPGSVDTEPLSDLVRWVRANGGSLSRSVQVVAIPGSGHGVRCTEKLAAGAAVVAVPEHLWMSEYSAGRSALGVALVSDPVLRDLSEGYVRL